MPESNVNDLPAVHTHLRAAADVLARHLADNPNDVEALDDFGRALMLKGGHRGRLNLAERDAAQNRRQKRDAERAKRRANARPMPTVRMHGGRLLDPLD
jgi:hypothetical protein